MACSCEPSHLWNPMHESLEKKIVYLPLGGLHHIHTYIPGQIWLGWCGQFLFIEGVFCEWLSDRAIERVSERESFLCIEITGCNWWGNTSLSPFARWVISFSFSSFFRFLSHWLTEERNHETSLSTLHHQDHHHHHQPFFFILSLHSVSEGMNPEREMTEIESKKGEWEKEPPVGELKAGILSASLLPHSQDCENDVFHELETSFG